MAAIRLLMLAVLCIISCMELLKVLAWSPPEILVTCFDCGDGVDRSDAAAAASTFCVDHWGTELFKYHGGYSLYYYWSDGAIRVSFVPFWNEEGCGLAPNNFFFNETRCYYDFMAPIDYCDTDGENGKHGGFYWDWCGNVTMNPNPHGGDGCPNHEPNWIPPVTDVFSHYASDQEHAATVAALTEFEQLPAADRDLRTTISSVRSSLSCQQDAAQGITQ